MMTVLANIDNRMPLDESHLDPHIEEYIGGWVEKKGFEKKTIYLFMHSSSFQCDYPVVAPTPGGFTALQSYGGLRGCTDQTRSHLRTIDAAFNQIHGIGPQLAAMKNPIKTSIERISLRFSHIPKAVIKVNLINFCYLWPPIIVHILPLTIYITFIQYFLQYYVTMKYHHRNKAINRLERTKKSQRDYSKLGHFNWK